MSILESDRVHDLLDRAGLGQLQPRTLKAVVAIGVLVVGAGLWRFWPAAPAPQLPFDEGGAQAPVAASQSAETSEPTAPDVVVHVAGAVMRPGVYTLPPGSRVGDAIRSAGGGLGTAALDSLNLARLLADGEQVYVLSAEQVQAGAGPPSASASAAPGGAGTDAARVNINKASASELEDLPGVGPATAQKIVDDREVNGPFANPEDLMRVPGIGPAKFEAMREMVSCG